MLLCRHGKAEAYRGSSCYVSDTTGISDIEKDTCSHYKKRPFAGIGR